MSAHSTIEWCDGTINPTSGCDGCEILGTCYARGLHVNRLAKSFPEKYAPSFLEVRMIAGRMRQAAGWRDLTGTVRLDKPWLNGMPRLVFISDMSDALSEAVSFEFLRDEIVATVAKWKHVGLWLTKRPKRMAAFAEWLAAQGINWPANLWAGTSVTSQQTADHRIPQLLRVPAKVRFLSCEPLLEALDLREHLGSGLDVGLPMINWVICGGESGDDARPMHPEWARSLRDQCGAAGVGFFFKQWGEAAPIDQITEVALAAATKRRQLCGKFGTANRFTGVTGEVPFALCGKRAAGRLLDGREHNAMPSR